MPEIIIYTTQTCPHCRDAKEYLISRGIRFIEKDISTDRASASELASANIMGVPAFKINGKFIIGFDRKRIDEMIKFDVVKCPECVQKLRLPAGKGKLRVSCSKCGHKFIVTT
ncbi:MAG TPA: glutaredoxin family protein [Spirochaetota bacterium]|nr:glutaredoxin family protein [Spirochaetota bacterium]